MHRILFCSILCFALQIQGFTQERNLITSDTKQILFLGNSITYSGEYLAFVETIYRLNHPKKNLEWLNLGLPSETVSGLSEEGHAGGAFPRPDLHERLDRILALIQPDLVFVNYGMNDGIYLPFDSTRFKKYEEGMKWLNSKIQVIPAQAVFLTPAIYDPIKGEAYSKTLDQYSSWLIDQDRVSRWQVIDIHFPMKSFLEEKRKTDPDFYLAKDGVHPNQIGHWLMARPILEYLAFQELTSIASFEDLIADYPNGLELFFLISQKQKILRDAYLSASGHLRPGIQEGLALPKAKKQAARIENQIKVLLRRN